MAQRLSGNSVTGNASRAVAALPAHLCKLQTRHKPRLLARDATGADGCPHLLLILLGMEGSQVKGGMLGSVQCTAPRKHAGLSGMSMHASRIAIAADSCLQALAL